MESKKADEHVKDNVESTSQLTKTPHITLLDDDDEEEDDVPLAKLSRTSKNQKGKGKKVIGQEDVSQEENIVGSSTNSSNSRPRRRGVKSIKQE